MRRPHRWLSPLAILFLLGALLPSLAIEVHEASELPVTLGSGHQTLYLAGHNSADKTLHIEPVTGIAATNCPGCLLREQRVGAEAEKPQAATAVVVASAPSRKPKTPLSGPENSSRIPRAPPTV